ncbi:MAG: hypothetical protein HRT44_09730 [Bdellovibrionales bacterium]|nr:hypothetical protein [Bdellovibrionales bacterium]NQZ19518.1 hypothetical protein [Bdellovibrionales bacterium]
MDQAVMRLSESRSISPGIYRTYNGLLTVVSILCIICIMGFVSYFLNSVDFIKAGIILIVSSMAIDLALIKPKILKNKMYLTHHFITMFWAIMGYFHAEMLVNYKPGFLVYMLLGAIFRRFLKISKDFAPDNKSLHWSIHKLMIFFDFCDPIVIILLWDWIGTLELSHQVFYFLLATVRIIINAKAYPEIREFFLQIRNSLQPKPSH